MKQTITIKGVNIGEGAPKICVPLVGRTLMEIVAEAGALRNIDGDIVEWRADFFDQVEDTEKVEEALTKIRALLPETPLIFTFRSAKEGGEKELGQEGYVKLNKKVAESGLVDIIDVELFNREEDVKGLVDAAHSNKVYVIISNHDFEKTPPKEEIIARLCRAQELGADFPKIAVMPNSANDVLTLLEATLSMNDQYSDRPIITMSMAGKGLISRLAGELFGSAVTFGAAKKASAPGQVAVDELRNVLSLLHQYR
ncbi:type I 3-dehydroquinate dehydratase [Mesobacillus foraminis]|uniref:type I 3-dehydroquinate dehydratase n=1 Tax=Mesobacillus foraminis TaxID=279826 RepID=UPI000EF47F5C|nr:type I 3-dehydroquinate dehydratase [Mesobacillus foraminis]